MKYKIEGFISDRDDMHTSYYLKYDNKLRQLRSFYNIVEPLVKKAQGNVEAFNRFQRNNYLDRFAVNVKTKKIKVFDKELIDIIESERKRYIKGYKDFPENLIMFIIIFSVSLFEFYIDSIVENINKNKSDKPRGMNKKIKHIKGNLNNIPKELSNYNSNINEIVNIRHVLIHNDGIIDEEFMKRVKNTEYEMGDKITLEKSLMHEVINNLHNYMTILDREYKVICTV